MWTQKTVQQSINQLNTQRKVEMLSELKQNEREHKFILVNSVENRDSFYKKFYLLLASTSFDFIQH